MSGLCCGIAAARHGIKVILIQDRPVLGGNASSEIRMWIGGCHGKDNRESGIIEEIMLENFYQNPSLKFPIWDSVLYQKAIEEKNLTLLLNTSCLDCTMDGNKIKSVKAWQSNAETFHVIEAKYFADCSGDSILSTLSGAEYMYGREAKTDFNETIPPDVADKKTMGMSCIFQIRETDRPVKFTAPKWAYKYESDTDLPYKDHVKNDNFWWIEVGGEWDCIHDTDRCREELIKICYGVWDHMKNYGDHGVDNWELEWIGFVPGKRESRRYVGKYIVTQNDVEAEGHFDDIVAYAGWSMDDHFPEGFYYRGGHPTIYHSAPSPFGIPLRALISKNIDNLTFAGRNISVTHAALSSCRVMATCAIMGEALGTAISLAIRDGVRPEAVNIEELQQILMDNDCYIPWHDRRVPQMTLDAKINYPIVRNGKDRGEENLWIGKTGDYIEYDLEDYKDVKSVRLVFDSNLNRTYHNMCAVYPMVEEEYYLPKTLLKEYVVEGEGEGGEIFRIHVTDNHQRLVKHAVDWKVKKIRFIPLSTNGCEEFRVFDFEIS
jgi:hypothetical protein